MITFLVEKYFNGIKKMTDTSKDEEIVRLLLSGKNPGEVSHLVGKHRDSVVNAAKRNRDKLSDEIRKKIDQDAIVVDGNVAAGLEIWRQYLKSEGRQELLANIMVKVAGLIEKSEKTNEIRDLCVSVGILIDKFQIEQGRTDDSAKAALVKLFEKLGEK